jgi:hypothetical protein
VGGTDSRKLGDYFIGGLGLMTQNRREMLFIQFLHRSISFTQKYIGLTGSIGPAQGEQILFTNGPFDETILGIY